MKPKLLSPWVASWVQAPEKAFEKLAINGKKDFKYTHSTVNECGVPPIDLLSAWHQKFL